MACQLLTSTTQFELEQISVYTDHCNMLVPVLQTSQLPSPVVPDHHSPTVPRAQPSRRRALRPKRRRDSGNFNCNIVLLYNMQLFIVSCDRSSRWSRAST